MSLLPDRTPKEIRTAVGNTEAVRGNVIHVSKSITDNESEGNLAEDISRVQSAAKNYVNGNLYKVGDFAFESGILYNNITAITTPEAFNPVKWVSVSAWVRNTGSGFTFLKNLADNVGFGINNPAEKVEVFGNIAIRQFGGFRLILGAQDNAEEGGEILWKGGGNSGSPFDDWQQDIFFETMRLFTTSSSPETFKVFNAGSSFINAIFDGQLHVGSDAAPAHTMDIHGTIGLRTLTSSGDITSDGAHSVLALLDTSAVRTVNLATIDNVLDRIIEISDRGGQAGTNNVTITPVSPALINGVASITTGIVANNGSRKVQSDGTNWFTL